MHTRILHSHALTHLISHAHTYAHNRHIHTGHAIITLRSHAHTHTHTHIRTQPAYTHRPCYAHAPPALLTWNCVEPPCWPSAHGVHLTHVPCKRLPLPRSGRRLLQPLTYRRCLGPGACMPGVTVVCLWYANGVHAIVQGQLYACQVFKASCMHARYASGMPMVCTPLFRAGGVPVVCLWCARQCLSPGVCLWCACQV
jgi:hypothetical protein